MLNPGHSQGSLVCTPPVLAATQRPLWNCGLMGNAGHLQLPPGRQEDLGPKAAIVICIVIAAELRCGCARKGPATLRASAEGILVPIPIMVLNVLPILRWGGFARSSKPLANLST